LLPNSNIILFNKLPNSNIILNIIFVMLETPLIDNIQII